MTGALECRVYAGKYKKDEAGKVDLGQTEDFETIAVPLDLSTRSSLSSPACPVFHFTYNQPWLS